MNQETNKYYVYFHINPIKNYIFYVGIGCNKRFKSKIGRNNFWKKTVSKYGFIVDIVEQNLTWTEAQDSERFYINKLGRRDLEKGKLVNLTNGGEGTVGMKQSDKQKEILRQRNIGNKFGLGFKHMLGTKQSHATKLKRSLSLKGRIFSEETRKKISLANKGKVSPLKGKKHSNETIEKISLKNSLKLINSNGVIFDSIGKAATAYGFKRTTLNAMLTGQSKNNKTDLKYVR